MKKRIPLYELIDKLDSKERIFIRKYISENLNASSKGSYLDFYDVLIKTSKLTDNEITDKLSGNKLKNYLSEAKFYLNKLIVKALRVHYTISFKRNSDTDGFLSNLERQKEIYIYFSKGLFKDAEQLCKKYASDWEKEEDFAMLSFVYKKMHQIELITGKNKINNNKYYELYTKLHQSNVEKSKYYYLSLEIEKELQKIEIARTFSEKKLFDDFLNLEIMLRKEEDVSAIYYWYIQILCRYALLNLHRLSYYFKKLYEELKIIDNKPNYDTVSRLQLISRLTYLSILTNSVEYYPLYKSYYLDLVSKSTFLTERYKKIHLLNSDIMESLFLFKQKEYNKMLKVNIPKLNIDNYIFEGTIMIYYVDLIFAFGKANFELCNFETALDYFNFIIDYKIRLKAKVFVVCNSFFHIWLIRYISKEYKILPSIANRFKIFLSKHKISFTLEKALLKFMYSCSNNYKEENIIKNTNQLLQIFESLLTQPIEKHLINQLYIIIFLKNSLSKKKDKSQTKKF